MDQVRAGVRRDDDDFLFEDWGGVIDDDVGDNISVSRISYSSSVNWSEWFSSSVPSFLDCDNKSLALAEFGCLGSVGRLRSDKVVDGTSCIECEDVEFDWFSCLRCGVASVAALTKAWSEGLSVVERSGEVGGGCMSEVWVGCSSSEFSGSQVYKRDSV